MWKVRDLVMLAAPLFLVVACAQSNDDGHDREAKNTYSLCPKTSDSRQRLYELAEDFAGQQKARFINRGAEAQRELANLKSGVLNKTGGNPILLTVEKPGEFRISVTNLGLKEKIALSVRSWGTVDDGGALAGFMGDLGRSWMIQKVDGNVTDSPPCSQLDTTD